MKILILLAIAAIPVFGQCGALAINPATGKLDCVGSAAASSADILLSTEPVRQKLTCSTTIAQYSVVKRASGSSGQLITPATAADDAVGVAQTACIGSGTSNVAMLGTASCIAEGAGTSGDFIILGTSDKTKCKSGGTDLTAIDITTRILGKAAANFTDGSTFSVNLEGVRFGARVSVANSSTSFTGQTSVAWTHNLNSLALLFKCQDSTGYEFQPTAILSALNTATFVFPTTKTGICVVNSASGGAGGGGGGGASTFDELGSGTNTTATMQVGSGATFKTAGTGAIDFTASGHTFPAKTGLAASKPGTCGDGEQYFATDATAGQNLYMCMSNTWTQQLNSGGGGGGGDTLGTPGTGILVSGPTGAKVVALDPSTQRQWIGGSGSLTFGTVSNNTCTADQSVTLTGVTGGEPLVVGPPATFDHALTFKAFASAANTVKIRLCNNSGGSIVVTDAQTWNVLAAVTF